MSRVLTAFDIAQAGGYRDAVVLLEEAERDWRCPYNISYNIFVRQRVKRAISC